MISLYHGLFARVLVDMDFSQPLLEKILAKMIDKESKLDVSFFVPISYENLPKFCMNFMAFTHDTVACKKGINMQTLQSDTQVKRLTSSIKWNRTMEPELRRNITGVTNKAASNYNVQRRSDAGHSDCTPAHNDLTDPVAPGQEQLVRALQPNNSADAAQHINSCIKEGQ